jgi:DNA polymerase-1
VDASLSKSLEFFQGVCESYHGTFLGNFNQAVTQTHRLSSSGKRIQTRFGERGAQFQNMARAFKRLFKASADDRVLVEADYRQLEFVAAGEVSHDPQVKADVTSRFDVHRYTASQMKNKPMESITDDERQDAKSRTFKPLYGGQTGTPAEQRYYAAFREKYRVLTETQHGWLQTVLSEKELRTASGLVFYWPDTRVQPSGYITNTTSIFNYPIQSFATADIVPIGLVHLFWRTQGADLRIINTIHDSVIADVHVENLDFYREHVAEAFTLDVAEYIERVYGRTLWIPLGGEIKSGTHWADKTDANFQATEF